MIVEAFELRAAYVGKAEECSSMDQVKVEERSSKPFGDR
jgi:hypothetical protein